MTSNPCAWSGLSFSVQGAQITVVETVAPTTIEITHSTITSPSEIWLIPRIEIAIPIQIATVPMVLDHSAFIHRSVFQPTLPSRLTPSNFFASAANSMGNSRNTSLQNPLTIMLMASSKLIPRVLQ